MQQRFFQLVQCGELLLVDGFEALGFDSKSPKLVDGAALLGTRWKRDDKRRKRPLIQALDVCADATVDHFSPGFVRLQEMAEIFRHHAAYIEPRPDCEAGMRNLVHNRTHQKTTTNQFHIAVRSDEKNVILFQHVRIGKRAISSNSGQVVERRPKIILKILDANDLDRGAPALFCEVNSISECRQFA